MDGKSRNPVEAGSFRGLFYGVGDYLHREVSSLYYAHRDAKAMYEVFGGNSENSRLATGAEVAKDKFRSDLNDLKMSSGPDDQVLIYFSGHGASSAHLVTYDADPANLSGTAIGLDELTTAMAEIPARSVVVALDCCFAGTDPDGAKVVRAPLNARGEDPVRPAKYYFERVNDEGRGRVLITASAADEKAWEAHHYRHGVFTYYLIKALISEPETAIDGKVSLNRVWAYLAERVRNDVLRYGQQRQNPTYSGTLAPDILLPRATPTARLRELWAEKVLPEPAGPNPESLLKHGISTKITEAWAADRISELNRLQIDAVNDQGVLVGSRLVVDAPTSSGKTLIGELAALRAVAEGERAVFLHPSRALVGEQFRRCARVYGQGSSGLRVVRAVGSVDDHVADIVSGRYDLAVFTYEKFAGLLLRHPGMLDGVGTVVVDELHNIADPERGAGLEMLLTRLRSTPRDLPLQIVGLSAVLGDDHRLDTWLRARLQRSAERPVPLRLAVLSHDGVYKYINYGRPEEDYTDGYYLPPAEDADAIALDFVKKAVADGEKVLLFDSSRYSVMLQAKRLADALRRAAATETLAELDTEESGRVTDLLKRCLRHGVAFHTAALTEHERGVLEESFRRRDEIKVIVSTTTLAQGVNLPADTVVLRDFEQGGGRAGRYSVAQYTNIAGRAGRTGLDQGQGRAVIIAQDEKDARQKWHGFVLAQPEKLCSTLAASDRELGDIVLAACANVPKTAAGRISIVRIIDFLGGTWAATQAAWSFGRDPFDPQVIDAAISHLVAFELLKFKGQDIVLTPLGLIAANGHLSADSARTLADLFEEAGADRLNPNTLIAAVQLIKELDTIGFAGMAAGRSINAAVDGYRQFLSRRKVAPTVQERMFLGGDALLGLSRARRTAACFEWAAGSPQVMVEKRSASFIPASPDGDPGPIFRVTERTADFLPPAIDIARLVCPRLGDPGNGSAWRERASVLPAQVELGLPADLAEIAIHIRPKLPRGVYLRLLREGLSNKQAFLDVGIPGVQACVGTAEGHAEILIAAAETAMAMAADRASLEDLSRFE